MYAVVWAGGKQHRVRPGDLVRVEKIDGDEGAAVVFDRVLMVAGEGDPKIGMPTVSGARVNAQIVRQGTDKKILVFKRKRKTNYHRKRGYRRLFTDLRITGIQVD
ncbi:MAG: 50S ribosomal protein L21 [Deltaproteobacteria bacterium]|nr:50S ribosomal protein L21 [Deltaproteobacteria bacterium]